MKKIVVNALQYKRNSSGIGVLIRELYGNYVKISKRTCQVILPEDCPTFLDGNKGQQVQLPFKHEQRVRRIWFQTFRLGKQYCKDAILLTTDSKISLKLPKSCMLIPLVTDLAVFRMPQVYQMSRVLLWRIQYLLVRKRAICYLTISEFTKQEMIELLHIPAEKIRVIPCACNASFAPVRREEAWEKLHERYHLPERFVLFVGNFNPRKNLERLIQAFDMAKEKGSLEHHLVISGEYGWKFSSGTVLSGIKHCDSIHFIGFVQDEDMSALYSLADLFAFPTLYEGFGIPVLEAQQCGTPVLTSDCSSLPEVGGSAAIYVNPYDTSKICEGILKVLSDAKLAEKLVEKGFENAQRFSWKKSAALLDKIIEEVAS